MSGKVLPRKVIDLKRAVAQKIRYADQIAHQQGVAGTTRVMDAINLARHEVKVFQGANRLNPIDSARYLSPIHQAIDNYELSVVQGVTI